MTHAVDTRTRRRLRVYQVDAFTTELFAGNPAGVVADADSLRGEEMQQIARELNCSETAFLLAPTSDDHDVWVRYFTPTTEVPICGHATIAAHYVRALDKDLSLPTTVTSRTGAGLLEVGVHRTADDDLEIAMRQGAPSFAAPLPTEAQDQLLRALGIERSELDERCPPPQVVSTGHSKVIVALRTVATIDALTPDLGALAALSELLECNGYFVFTQTLGESLHTYGRMFAPAIGIPEDPVTGNANGPLGAYLVEHGLAATSRNRLEFIARQGDALGRPGSMRVVVEARDGHPTSVTVIGRAIVVFSTTITL